MILRSVLISAFAFVFISCGENNISTPRNPGSGNQSTNNPLGANQSTGWLIPQSEVLDGGPGKDGIPALENPEFIITGQVDYLSDDDLVLGYKNGTDVRAYPHPILDWHEIINDQIGEDKVAITYCPLTGTGIGWDRIIEKKLTTFGVSGLLYNSNLIPYDRSTDSNWSQIRLDCVNGTLQGTEVKTYQLVETTWNTWKDMYPGSKVVSKNTGHQRNYGTYPYGNYRTNHDYILFRVNPEDKRLPAKTRVLGVLYKGEKKAYRLNEFIHKTRIIYDEIENDQFVVVGNKEKNFMVAFFRRTKDNSILEFEPVQDKKDIIMTDLEGNEWNIFGEAVSGPREGQKLLQPISFIGYWFSWGAFYPQIEIYDD